jgi:hypothetical protein
MVQTVTSNLVEVSSDVRIEIFNGVDWIFCWGFVGVLLFSVWCELWMDFLFDITAIICYVI